MPKVKFLKGKLNKEQISKYRNENNLSEKKTIFVFPSGEHLGHHGGKDFNEQLFQIVGKDGGGLARVAVEQGNAGNPTLGLPTIFTENISADKKEKIIEQSLAHLWQAVGAGYDLMFPVRKITEENKQYFGEGSEISIQGDSEQYHLKWYGGMEKTPNHVLADRYAMHAQVLSAFVSFEENYKKNNAYVIPDELFKAFKEDLKTKNSTFFDKFNNEWESIENAYTEGTLNQSKLQPTLKEKKVEPILQNESNNDKNIAEIEVNNKTNTSKPLKTKDVIKQLTEDGTYQATQKEGVFPHTVENKEIKAKIFVHEDTEGNVTKIGVELPSDENAKKIIELITKNPDVAFRVSNDSKNDNLRTILQKAIDDKQIVLKDGLYTSAGRLKKEKSEQKTNENKKENKIILKPEEKNNNINKIVSNTLKKEENQTKNDYFEKKKKFYNLLKTKAETLQSQKDKEAIENRKNNNFIVIQGPITNEALKQQTPNSTFIILDENQEIEKIVDVKRDKSLGVARSDELRTWLEDNGIIEKIKKKQGTLLQSTNTNLKHEEIISHYSSFTLEDKQRNEIATKIKGEELRLTTCVEWHKEYFENEEVSKEAGLAKKYTDPDNDNEYYGPAESIGCDLQWPEAGGGLNEEEKEITLNFVNAYNERYKQHPISDNYSDWLSKKNDNTLGN